MSSDNYNLGGSLSYDLWLRGRSVFFGGVEFKYLIYKDLTFKLENNPFDYFKFSCCGEGLSEESYKVRKKRLIIIMALAINKLWKYRFFLRKR